MYKRTKGQCKGKSCARTANDEVMDRVIEISSAGAAPISLIVSPKTRVKELKSIFESEYPALNFDALDV
jgi:hypothetical protein